MTNKQNMNEIHQCIKVLLSAVVLLLTILSILPAANAENSEGGQIIVSLGDSYSSGEGIEPFYGQDKDISEKVKDHDWLSHRSQNSWPGMLTLSSVSGTMAENRGTCWYFAAVSGAVTSNMLNEQCKEYDKQWSEYTGVEKIAAQLDVFDELGENKADYVTLTLGGNDADFVGVIQDAAIGCFYLTPNSLANKINDTWKDFYKDGGIRDNLRQAYEEIAKKAGEQAQIIVAGYPQLLDLNVNSAPFSVYEAAIINNAVSKFNVAIEDIIDTCAASGMKICFVPVEDAFKGHGAYSDEPYIHKLMCFQSEDINDKVSLSTISNIISAYSIHPNYEGARAYATCVQAKIDELETNPNVPTTSDERDIVLVLDTSASMSGSPLEETKKAATNFINTILGEDASIGIVTYNDTASVASDFLIQTESLRNIIARIYSGGNTNIEAGLSTAYNILQNSNAKKKIIVLMSDGEPNRGKEGNELVAYSDELKDSGVLIYTVGFFESMSSGKSSAQTLMEGLASDGCHYEVASADDLLFFFEDVADQINGQRYIYVRIACPVDVSVTYNEETLSSAEKNLNFRTSFGSLSFEESEDITSINSNDQIKVLRLKEGVDYDLQIVGIGRGIMNYMIGFMGENGDYSDFRKFENIKINKKTIIDTVVSVSNTSILNIDEDGDGKYDVKYQAGANEYGEEITVFNWTYILICASGAALLILIIIGIAVRKLQSQKGKAKKGE